MEYEIPPPKGLKLVRLMFAASEPMWVDKYLTVNEYIGLFLNSSFDGLALLYIWPPDHNVMYSCEHRQWMQIASIQEVTEKFLKASVSMTNRDVDNVRRIVQLCMNCKS